MLRQISRAYFRWFPVGLLKPRLYRQLVRKPAPGTIRETTTRDGVSMRLDLHQLIDRFIYYWGEWEPSETALLRRLLAPGDVFADAGANIGYYSLLAARLVGPRGGVVAFEPVPETARRLRENVALNGFGNVTVHELALSDREGLVRIRRVDARNIGRDTISPAARAEASFEVRSARLDDLLDGPVRLLKLDLEGAEMLALRGFERGLAGGPDVLCELTDALLREVGGSAAELVAFMAERGYLPYRVTARGLRREGPGAVWPGQASVLFSRRDLGGLRWTARPGARVYDR